MKIIRVFPRRTKATPTDELAVVGSPRFWDEADEVHISVTFSWNLEEAERLAYQWERVAPVKIGGPATGMRGEEFEPGRYLARGYTITSRGCPNHCWFCDVWKRDGDVRELPIRAGWNVLDDNLLATSKEHQRAVFEMLERQDCRVEFTGGLEAARFTEWHAERILRLKPKQVFFAFDEASDWEPLVDAVERVRAAWPAAISGHRLRCYVLVGYPTDTMPKAESRLHSVITLGVVPMAMLWRGRDGVVDPEWRRFQRLWARPAVTVNQLNERRQECLRTLN